MCVCAYVCVRVCIQAHADTHRRVIMCVRDTHNLLEATSVYPAGAYIKIASTELLLLEGLFINKIVQFSYVAPAGSVSV